MMFELETNKLLDDEQVFKNSFYNFASEYVRTYFNNNIDTKKKTSDETFLSATLILRISMQRLKFILENIL